MARRRGGGGPHTPARPAPLSPGAAFPAVPSLSRGGGGSGGVGAGPKLINQRLVEDAGGGDATQGGKRGAHKGRGQVAGRRVLPSGFDSINWARSFRPGGGRRRRHCRGRGPVASEARDRPRGLGAGTGAGAPCFGPSSPRHHRTRRGQVNLAALPSPPPPHQHTHLGERLPRPGSGWARARPPQRVCAWVVPGCRACGLFTSITLVTGELGIDSSFVPLPGRRAGVREGARRHQPQAPLVAGGSRCPTRPGCPSPAPGSWAFCRASSAPFTCQVLEKLKLSVRDVMKEGGRQA